MTATLDRIRPLTPEADDLAALGATWARCRRWIVAALEHAGATHTEADVLDMIRVGEAQLWPGERSAAVTELVRYPRCTICRVWLAGGELRELVDRVWPAIKAWAKEKHACTAAVVEGRRWHRLLGGRESYKTTVEL